jgi:hypothetical protein
MPVEDIPRQRLHERGFMVIDGGHFDGLRVAAFESRRAADMARLIERFGGAPYVSPSLREVPIAENREAIDFAHRLITGGIGSSSSGRLKSLMSTSSNSASLRFRETS